MEKFNKTQNFNYDNEAGFSPEGSHLNWEDYKVLKEQAKWDSEAGGNVQMNLDDIGTEYIRNAAGLIAVMDGSAERYFRSDRLIRDGEEDVEHLKNFEKPPKPDHVLHLDKSERPGSWLINLLWKDLAVEGSKKPDFSYLNIDRADFFPLVGLESDQDGRSLETGEVLKPIDFDQKIKEDSDEVREGLRQIKLAIRSQYIDEKMIDPNGDIEEQILSLPTKLDGKNLLVIDETSRSGSTLHMAMRLMKIAIPELKNIHGEYLWTQTVRDTKSGESAGAPVWYDANNSDGRGTGDRSEYYHSKKFEKNPTTKNLLRKIGSLAISAPIFDFDEENGYKIKPDPKAMALARDFKQLRKDFRDGKILFMPPMNYSEERVDEIFEKQGFIPEIDPIYGDKNWSSAQKEMEKRKK